MVVTPRRLRRLTAAALGVLTAIPLALAAPSAQASDGLPTPASSPAAAEPSGTSTPATFGIGPATGGKLDRRAHYSLLLGRGQSARDQVAIVNLTEARLTLNLYAADAVNGPDGSLGLESRGAKSRDLASWVTLTTPTRKPYVVVPARSTIIVPFTVRVPKNAYVGDHLAGIVTSIVAKGETPGQIGTNVTLEQRIGIRLGLRVAGTLVPQLQVEDLTVDHVASTNPLAPGSAVVAYTVRNTGNVRLGARQHVGVEGPFGTSADAGPLGDVPVLLPNGAARVSVTVPDVWPLFRLTTEVTVTPLPVVGDASPEAAIVTASTTFWAVPWLAIAVLIGLVIVGLWLVRRRRTTPPAPTGRREQTQNHQPELVDATPASEMSA